MGRMWLTIDSGSGDGHRVEIADRLTVGRDAVCDVVLADAKASRRHAHFTVAEDGRVFVNDLGSTNGTFVDGRRVEGMVPLLGGERIRIGDTEATVSAEDPGRTAVGGPALTRTDGMAAAGLAAGSGAPAEAPPAPPSEAPWTPAPVAVQAPAAPSSPAVPQPAPAPQPAPSQQAARTPGSGGWRRVVRPFTTRPRLTVVILVLLVLLSALNVTARTFAQRTASKETARALQMSRQPDVTLKGFPFLVRALMGNLSEVSLSSGKVTVKDVPVERFSVSFHGVTYSLRQMMSDRPGAIHASTGEGTVAMSGATLTSLLRKFHIPIDVGIGNGGVHINGGSLPGIGQIFGQPGATLGLAGDRLTLNPIDLPFGGSFSLPLPAFVPGLRYLSVKVEGSLLVLTFRLQDVTLQVPKA